MFEAEFHGKPVQRNGEDLLTSRFFGLIRYMPPGKVLLPVLSRAINVMNDCNFSISELKSAKRVEYVFWPRSNAEKIGEPDLCLIFHCEDRDYLVVIEVKLESHKHGEGEEYDQLMRYYMALDKDNLRRSFSERAISSFNGHFLGIIYLTVDRSKEEIRKSHDLLEEKNISADLYGLTWRDVHDGLKAAISMDTDSWYVTMLQELAALLDLLHLRHFAGWEIFSGTEIPEIVKFLFYRFEVKSIRKVYNWPVSKLLYNTNMKGKIFYVRD
jgi:hypothetical protein